MLFFIYFSIVFFFFELKIFRIKNPANEIQNDYWQLSIFVKDLDFLVSTIYPTRCFNSYYQEILFVAIHHSTVNSIPNSIFNCYCFCLFTLFFFPLQNSRRGSERENFFFNKSNKFQQNMHFCQLIC